MQFKSFKTPIKVIFCSLIISCSFPLCAQQSDPDEFYSLLTEARKFTAERKWNDAIRLWEQIVERNPVNGEYAANLGDAYYNAASYRKAIEAYKKQMDLRFGSLFIAAYNIACCYALAAEKEPALEWLQRSFDLGFRSYTHAQNDADLRSLHNDPRFIKILAMDDVGKMSRTEGWKYDMEVLKREVMRKAYFRRELSLDEFNKQYKELYNSIDRKTDVQITMGLMKLLGEVKDGHTALFLQSRPEFRLSLPLQFYLFKEGVYIIASDQKNKNILGTKVVGFDKKTTDEVIKTLSPLHSRDNASGLLNTLAGSMRMTALLNGAGLTKDPAKVELHLIDTNGKKFSALIEADTVTARVEHKSVPANWVTLYQANGKPIPSYLKDPKLTYWFERVPGTNVVYLQWNTVRNDSKEPLNAFTDRLFDYINKNEVDKLVIDLRWNNGGNTMLLPYFIQSVIRNDKVNKRGNLFVITGRRTFSAAQNLSTFLEKQTAATFVGEPTGSSPNFVGEEDFITLPYSKLAMNVSDLFWQSSWPWDQRTWIAPSLYIPPTFKDYNSNRDVVLETIVKYVSAKRGF